ncbi:unnamed protein product, partial [Choristocarpus tenellus]
MGDGELILWVSDRLHDVLGFSDSSTAQFVIALARKAASSGRGGVTLLEGLADLDVPSNATTKAFTTELLVRLGGGDGKVNASHGRSEGRPGHPTNAELLQQSQSYALLSSDDEDVSQGRHGGRDLSLKKREKVRIKYDQAKLKEEKRAEKASRRDKKKMNKGGRRRRTDIHGESSSEDDTVVRPKRIRPDNMAMEETEESRAALQRDRDIEERDALVERMLERDKNKTKKAELGGLTPAQIQELATRGVVKTGSGEDRALTMTELRDISRQMYLPKRAEKELKLLEMQLQDEEELFLKEG